jgi:hypothetical protein
MNEARKLRQAIKSQFPTLKFTVKTVNMADITGKSELVVTSPEWGMAVDNHELYHQVKVIADKYNAVIVW